jgi:hypothetical protein
MDFRDKDKNGIDDRDEIQPGKKSPPMPGRPYASATWPDETSPGSSGFGFGFTASQEQLSTGFDACAFG